MKKRASDYRRTKVSKNSSGSYECTDNDNHLYMVFEDGNLDELHVSDCLQRSWLVVGLDDLREALRRAGYQIVKVHE